MDGPSSTAAATVIITDGSDEAHALMERMAVWAAAGLVDMSWWIDGRSLGPTDIGGVSTPLNAAGLLRIEADRIGSDGRRSVPFLQSLGENPYDVYRVVMVHMLPLGSSGDVGVARHARNFLEQLRPNLSTSSTIAQVNLLIPVTGTESVDTQILQPGWRANVLVSPEDEVSDRHTSIGVAHPGNFISHAAVHVATVGGMWSGMDSGPFDRSVESADGEPDPITIRAFVRVVRSLGVVDEIAVAAISEAGATGWDLPSDPKSGDQPLQAVNPGAVIEVALESAAELDGGMLRFNAAERIAAPAPAPIGILKALTLIFRYFWAALARLPEAAVGRLRQAVTELAEDRATEFAFGDDSLFVARLDGKLADRDAPSSPLLNGVTDEATRILTLLGSRTTVGPTPGLWQALRRFCFGIADGSELPSELPVAAVGSRRQLITRPDLLVADPDNDFFELAPYVVLGTGLSQWSGIRITTCDTYLARRLEADLVDAAGRIELAAGSNPTNDDRQIKEQLDNELSRLRNWISPRSTTFLWQLGERISGQLTKAVNVMTTAQPIVVAGWSGIDFTEPANRLRRMHRSWLITVLVAISVIVALWLWDRLRPYAPVGTPVTLIAAFVIAFIVFRRYIRAIFQWEARAQQTIANYKQAKLDLDASSQETVRLGVMYQQFVEWAEIIGWILHHPWAPYVGEEREEETLAPEAAQAIQMAQARPREDHIQRLGTRARRDLMHIGWLGARYEAAAQQAAAETAIALGLTNDQQPNADVDTPLQPNGARSGLLDSLRTKRPQERARDQAVGAVATFCASLLPAEVFHDVGLVEGGAQGDVSVDDFLALVPPTGGAQPFDARLWNAEDLVDGAAAVSSTSIWMWGAPPVAAGVYDMAFASPTTDERGSYIARSIRLDHSARRPTSSYTVFAETSAAVESPPVGAADSDAGDGPVY